MKEDFASVPVHREECIREVCTDGFTFTESFHRPSDFLPLHAHELATITIPMVGNFVESYVKEREHACADVMASVLFRPPGAYHADRMGKTGVQNLVIELTHNKLLALKPFAETFQNITHVQALRVPALVTQIRSELQINDAVSQLGLEGLALELITVITRHQSLQIKKSFYPPKWLQTIHDLMHDDISKNHDIDGLAKLANVHPVYFARAFRQYYGDSPSNYLRKLRIQWAAKQLTTGKIEIADIASQAGFVDQSHFTREFKRQMGITPMQFLRKK